MNLEEGFTYREKLVMSGKKITQLFKKIDAEIQDMVDPTIMRRRLTGKIGDEDDEWFINSLKSRLFFASQS